jgi:hypothetical protein
MQCEGGSETVQKTIGRVNRELQRMGQPAYHENPAIHVSIGWSSIISVGNTNKKEGMKQVIEEIADEDKWQNRR